MNNDTRSREEILKDTLAEGLRIQHQFKPEPLYKRTGKGSYQSQTVKEIAAAKKKLCAELKAGLEADETEFVALDAGKIIREAKARREADDHSA